MTDRQESTHQSSTAQLPSNLAILNQLFIIHEPNDPDLPEHDILESDENPFTDRRYDRIPMDFSDLKYLDNYIWYCEINDDEEHLKSLNTEMDYAFRIAGCEDLHTLLKFFLSGHSFHARTCHLAKVLKILFQEGTIQKRLQMLTQVLLFRNHPKSLLCVALTFMRGSDVEQDLEAASNIFKSTCELIKNAQSQTTAGASLNW